MTGEKIPVYIRKSVSRRHLPKDSNVREVLLQQQKRERKRVARIRYLASQIPGVGPATADELVAEFGPVPKITEATPDQLQRAYGVGPSRARSIHRTLRGKLSP